MCLMAFVAIQLAMKVNIAPSLKITSLDIYTFHSFEIGLKGVGWVVDRVGWINFRQIIVCAT